MKSAKGEFGVGRVKGECMLEGRMEGVVREEEGREEGGGGAE